MTSNCSDGVTRLRGARGNAWRRFELSCISSGSMAGNIGGGGEAKSAKGKNYMQENEKRKAIRRRRKARREK
jgi:hypothetical protein